MWKKADALIITEEERRTIEAWLRAQKTPQRILLRSRICLLATEDISHSEIARRLDTSRPTVVLWTKRFREQGLSGLSEDAPHGISSRRLETEKVKSIVEATLHTKPQEQLIGQPALWPKPKVLVMLWCRGYGMRMACNLTA